MDKEDMQFGYSENYCPRFDETKLFYLAKRRFYLRNWKALTDLVFYFNENEDLVEVIKYDNDNDKVEFTIYRKGLIPSESVYKLEDTQNYYEVLKDTSNFLLLKHLKKILIVMLKQEQAKKEEELEKLKEQTDNLK